MSSGLLLTSKNIYGIVNPPPDPSDNLPESHQTIGSAAVRWDYFQDLCNNIGKGLIAGQNISIIGNTISSTATGGGGGGGGGAGVSYTEKITSVDLCNNSLFEITFSNPLINKTYDLSNIHIVEDGQRKTLSELIVLNNKLLAVLDYSYNNNDSININNIAGEIYKETFNDQDHSGSFINQGEYVSGIGNILTGKKVKDMSDSSNIPIFRLTSGNGLPETQAKALSFWVKDYSCLSGNWLFSSGSNLHPMFAFELYVPTNNDKLYAFGSDNLGKIYLDGEEVTSDSTGVLSKDISAGTMTGFHHFYLEAQTYFRDIELMSRNGEKHSFGIIDDVKLYSSALDVSSIQVLSTPPIYQEISDISKVYVMYIPGQDVSKNLITNINYVQKTLWTPDKGIYNEDNNLLNRYYGDISLNESIADLSQNTYDLVQASATPSLSSLDLSYNYAGMSSNIIILNMTHEIKDNSEIVITDFMIHDKFETYRPSNVLIDKKKLYLYNRVLNNTLGPVELASNQVYYNNFNNDVSNTSVTGLFDVGNAIKNGTSQMFSISTSNTLPNNVKSLSFWIKDYECLNDNWLLESDLSGSNRMALTAGGTPENTLKIFGPNAKRIYIDGIEHTITGTTGYRTITPARQASYFSGWHHIYVSVIENLVDLEIASSNNTNHSSLTLDELRMYSRELTNYEIRNLYNNGPATNISNIENIKVVYEKNDNSIFNIKTITESVFQSFSRDGRGLLNIQKEHLTDLSDVSYNSLELTNKQLLQWDSSTDRWIPREAILPLLSKVDTILPNKIKLTFSEEIKSDTTYNLNNFIVRYDTFDLSCDKIDISNGDVIIETPVELNGNEILLSGTSSDLSNGQVNTDSGDAETGHSASDLFDNSLSGKYISVNTVFDAASPYSYTGTGDTAGYSGLWIQIDLSNASDYHITKVRIYPSNPVDDTDRHPKSYKIFSSVDGTNWTERKEETGLEGSDWKPISTTYRELSGIEIKARYWRVAIGSLISDKQSMYLGEIRLFGKRIEDRTIRKLVDPNKLDITYLSTNNNDLMAQDSSGIIDSFQYKGLGLTNITKEDLGDLSNVDISSVKYEQFLKWNGSQFIPTYDISDISFNLSQLQGTVGSNNTSSSNDINNLNTQLTNKINTLSNEVIRDISDLSAVVFNRFNTLLDNAPNTLDTLKEIADVIGDPTDPSGGVGTIIRKTNDISNNLNTFVMNNRGQRIFEILTQQPAKFTSSGITSTAGEVTINWNYDDILANTAGSTLARFASESANKSKNIPYVDRITVELSGNSSVGSSNTWVNYGTGIWQPKVFSTNENYNSNTYKTITFTKTPQSTANNSIIKNILSKTDLFDVRIYGTNFAEDYPTINDRSLYFNGISFLVPQEPSKAIISSQNGISSNSSITFQVKANETENGKPNSAAVIIDASNTYYAFETRSSITNGVAIPDPISYSQTNTNISNVAKNTNFSVSISSLRSGTKYKYYTQLRNDLTSTDKYSEQSDEYTTDFTRTPSSSGASNFTSSWFNTNTYSYRVSTPDSSWPINLNNSTIRWLNKANNHSLNVSSTSTRTFEISKSYTSSQQLDTVGYGRFIDNSQNLVNIQVEISGVKYQELTYGGFNVNSARNNVNSNTFNFFDSPSSYDPYNSNNNSKGFRLNGQFSINNIPYSNIGDASNVAYTIKYKYVKDALLGGGEVNNGTNGVNVYIDNLSGNPSITRDGTEIYAKTVLHCMGIPSIQTFDISFSRTYSNINSEYQYCRYHTNSPAGITVGLIYSVSKTNRSSSSYNGKINISRGDIVSNGTYSFNDSQIDLKTSDRFRNIYFTQTIGMPTSGDSSPNDSLSIQEKSFNLNGEDTTTNNYTLQYYCDYSSFNKSSSKISTQILSLTNIGEINDITKLGSSLRDMSVDMIANHETIVKNWTLLFIEGKFKTNTAQRYPSIPDYVWTKQDGTTFNNLTYNAGGTSYALDGTTTGSGNKYKWIVFKFSESNKSTHNSGGTNYEYLNIYNLLTSNYYFTSSIMNKLKDVNDSDVVGFVQQEYSSENRIGNLMRGYSPSSLWYGNDANNSFDTIFNGADKSGYGCRYEESSTKWGPLLDTANGETDIYVYIGYNNAVSIG